MPRSCYSLACLGLFFLLVAGCASHVSPETVRLSSELTVRSKDMEAAHLEAVNRFFDAERARIEDFMQREWTPLFLRNLVGQSGVLDDLRNAQSIDRGTRNAISAAAALYLTDPDEAPRLADEVADTLTRSRADEPAALRSVVNRYVPDNQVDAAVAHIAQLVRSENQAVVMIQFAEAASIAIDRQRRELLDPLEQAREQVLRDVRSAYGDLYAGQAVITGRLEAARRLSDEQRRLFDNIAGQEGASAAARARLAGLSGRLGQVLDDAAALSGAEAGDPAAVAAGVRERIVKTLEEAGFRMERD